MDYTVVTLLRAGSQQKSRIEKGFLQTHPWEYAIENKNTQRVGEMTWSGKSCCASKRDLSLAPAQTYIEWRVVEKGFSLKLIV